MSLDLEIRRLSQRDMCDAFSAGTDPDHVKLNEFFHRYAKQNDARRATATFVALAGDAIAGFVTISPGVVDPARLADRVKSLSRHPAPVLVLARMATDARFQRQGVGRRLLRDVVFARAISLADEYGCVGVYVDSKPSAITFYSQCDFVAIPLEAPGTTQAPMFMPLKAIRQAASRSPADTSNNLRKQLVPGPSSVPIRTGDEAR